MTTTRRARGVPDPPDRLQRDEPLPWQRVKAGEDDPEAASRVKALIESDSYAEADRDAAFLQRDPVRGARIQLDYMKPELLLNEHGVRNTIVVFGGTRIPEEAEARRRVDSLERLAAAHPDDDDIKRRVTIARRVLAKSRYYEIAREFGSIVGQARDGTDECRLLLMTGGGPGIMEAANRGAYDVGAKSIGLNISLPHEQYPNPYVSPGLCFSVRYFAIRKLHFLMRARALVVFPGGFGTIDELFETLTLVQTRKIDPLPIVLVGERFWRRAFDFDFLVDEGVVDPEDRELFWYAESAGEIWNSIGEWYQKSGNSLTCDRVATP